MPFIGNLPISTIFLLPVLPRSIHLFLDAALLKEIAFLPLDEPTNQHITLMDERDGNVGDSLVGAFLDLLSEDGRVEMSLLTILSTYSATFAPKPLQGAVFR